MLDPITEQEIREYEEYCKQQDTEFEAGLMTHEEAEKAWRESINEGFREIAENADYYNDYM